MKEGEIQGLKGTGVAAGLDALDDLSLLGGGRWGWVGDVGETHFASLILGIGDILFT